MPTKAPAQPQGGGTALRVCARLWHHLTLEDSAAGGAKCHASAIGAHATQPAVAWLRSTAADPPAKWRFGILLNHWFNKLDLFRRGPTRPDVARRGSTRLDAAQRGSTRPEAARGGSTRFDAIRCGSTRPDVPGRGSDVARRAWTRLDAARSGSTRLDAARRGSTRPDAARRG